MYQHILDLSAQENKNILIIGSPRSGTHALGSQLSMLSPEHEYLGEICKIDHREAPWEEISVLATPNKIAHLVAFSSKVRLSGQANEIKNTSIVVNLRRKNKVDQFASWMYFHRTGGVNGKWHNHAAADTLMTLGSITATDFDIDQFILEQLIDSFFCANITLQYEDLIFDRSKYVKNSYSFNLPEVFSNLDYVQQRLSNWKYPDV